VDNIKITLVQKIKTKEEKSREKFKRELYKQMSLTDKSFVRKAGNEEDDYKGSQIKQLPASMQNFYQTIYFNFMVTIDEVFPDEDSNINLDYKYADVNIFENSFLQKTEQILQEKFQVRFKPKFKSDLM